MLWVIERTYSWGAPFTVTKKFNNNIDEGLVLCDPVIFFPILFSVVLLGDSRVGKSSILHRFTQNEFKEDMRSGILSDDLSTK